jgi:dTDP-4-dehydrorhamnose 3,5-epimerase
MKWTDGKIDGVEIRDAVKRTDPRGWLAEVFRSDEMNAGIMPAMGYVSVTHSGVARGPHEHKKQTDLFAFFGPGAFKIRMWDNRKASPTYGRTMTFVVGEDHPTVVVVPPGVIHGYRNISSGDAWVMNFPNRLYAGKGKRSPVDEVRYEDGSHPDLIMD